MFLRKNPPHFIYICYDHHHYHFGFFFSISKRDVNNTRRRTTRRDCGCGGVGFLFFSSFLRLGGIVSIFRAEGAFVLLFLFLIFAPSRRYRPLPFRRVSLLAGVVRVCRRQIVVDTARSFVAADRIFGSSRRFRFRYFLFYLFLGAMFAVEVL